MDRGGNGSDSALPISVFIFLKRIRMQIWILSNTNMDRIFFQYGTDTNNKILDLYLIVSQVYNDIIHNSLKSNSKKILLTILLAFLVR
jgi:regulatory protein YycH of two-component signal transduction system YycFG